MGSLKMEAYINVSTCLKSTLLYTHVFFNLIQPYFLPGSLASYRYSFPLRIFFMMCLLKRKRMDIPNLFVIACVGAVLFLEL